MEHTEKFKSGSLRIAAAFSVAALLVVVGIRIAPQSIEAPLVIERASANHLSPRDYIEETDTDADGVPDWKEVLRGTDIDNPDTDGDGVMDGDETSSPRQAFDVLEEDTLTVKISNRIVEEYLALKESGAYTPERGRAAGQRIADEVRIVTPFAPYVGSELVVVDASIETAAAHRAGIQSALQPIRGFREPEILLYARYIEIRNPADLEELARRADLYRAASEGMLAVPVPADLADTHLATANALSFFAAVLDNMIVQVHDPLASITMLNVFTRAEAYLESTLGQINDYHRAKLASST